MVSSKSYGFLYMVKHESNKTSCVPISSKVCIKIDMPVLQLLKKFHSKLFKDLKQITTNTVSYRKDSLETTEHILVSMASIFQKWHQHKMLYNPQTNGRHETESKQKVLLVSRKASNSSDKN